MTSLVFISCLFEWLVNIFIVFCSCYNSISVSADDFVSSILNNYQTLVTNLRDIIAFLGGSSHGFMTEHNMPLFFDTYIFSAM